VNALKKKSNHGKSMVSDSKINPHHSRRASGGSFLKRPYKKGKHAYFCNACGLKALNLLLINDANGKKWVLGSKCDLHIKVIFTETFCYSSTNLHVIGIAHDKFFLWYECECPIGKSHYQEPQC
jgi:hypothetical protein